MRPMKRRRERRLLLGAVTTIAACYLNKAPPARHEILEARDLTVSPGVTVPLLLGLTHAEDTRARSGCGRMSANGCRWERNVAPANGYGAFIALAERSGSREVRPGPGGEASLAADLPTRALALTLVRPARVVGCASPDRARVALRVDTDRGAGDRWSVFKTRGHFAVASVVRQPGWVCPGVDDGTERGMLAECACLFAHASAWQHGE